MYSICVCASVYTVVFMCIDVWLYYNTCVCVCACACARACVCVSVFVVLICTVTSTSEYYYKACGVGLSCTCSHLSIFTIWYCGLVCCSVVTVYDLLPPLQLLPTLPCTVQDHILLFLQFPQVSGKVGHCVMWVCVLDEQVRTVLVHRAHVCMHHVWLVYYCMYRSVLGLTLFPGSLCIG